MRVLAGDTPVDWTRLREPADWQRLGDNNLTFAKIIGNEVIAKRRHALVILGNNHLSRGGTFRDRSPNAASLIEARCPGSLYIAMIHYGGFGDSASDARVKREGWTAPTLVPLTSWIGDRPVATTTGTLPLRAFADALLRRQPARPFDLPLPGQRSWPLPHRAVGGSFSRTPCRPCRSRPRHAG
jgi:hypothetical protein